jgi:hypothetical protein
VTWELKFGAIYAELKPLAEQDHVMRQVLANTPKPPDLIPGAALFLEAFWKLCSCRSVGWAEGPIPWTAVVEYGTICGLSGEDLFDFEEIILAMDKAFLRHRSETNTI